MPMALQLQAANVFCALLHPADRYLSAQWCSFFNLNLLHTFKNRDFYIST